MANIVKNRLTGKSIGIKHGKIKAGLGSLIGNTGEHYVIAELLKRGIIAAQTPRNAIAFDILATNGGRTFGQMLALIADKRFAYADKKPKPTGEGKKQEYSWDLSQFEFERGECVAIAEDVYNNFQNTDNTLAEVAATGAKVVCLVGALNRSPVCDKNYKGLPIIASICEAYPEYRQDDPAVAADIAAGRLELEVKKNWARLMRAMAEHSA